MKNILMILIVSLFLISLASAESIRKIEQGENITLPQLCSSCSYNNIVNILYPDGSIILENLTMEKLDSYYYYNLTGNYTNKIGIYTVNGIGDIDGINTNWKYTFEVKKLNTLFNIDLSLFQNNIFLIVIFSISIVLFFFQKYSFSGVLMLVGGILMALNSVNLVICLVIIGLSVYIISMEGKE